MEVCLNLSEMTCSMPEIISRRSKARSNGTNSEELLADRFCGTGCFSSVDIRVRLSGRIRPTSLPIYRRHPYWLVTGLHSRRRHVTLGGKSHCGRLTSTTASIHHSTTERHWPSQANFPKQT